MPITYGLTSSGFVKKPLTVILQDLQDGIHNLPQFGANFDVSTESPMGQFLGLVANVISEVWDESEAVYAAFNPDGATGVSLDNVCATTGTKRNKAISSTVNATLTGTPGAVIAAATFSTNDALHSQFTMDADATIGGGGTVVQACTAVNPGAVIANAGTLTVIDTPRVGLASVTNAFDATVGAPIEPDPPLRLRREAELAASGSAITEAIRAKVLSIKDANGLPVVTACTVFDNPTDSTDGNGLPPHSINVLANCATGASIDTAVATAIFNSKGSGIQTYGAASATVTDSQGIVRTFNFDRPTALNVYVILNLTVDATQWPVDGVAQVKAALLSYGATAYVDGKDVVASALSAQSFKVPGLLDAPPALIGLAPNPAVSTTIAVSIRQIAKLDTSRITVNVTPGTP